MAKKYPNREKWLIYNESQGKKLDELILRYNLPLEKFVSLSEQDKTTRTNNFRYEMTYLWNKKENTKEILERILFEGI